MRSPTVSETARLHDLKRRLATFSEGEPPVLREVVGELRALLRAERGHAYGVSTASGSVELAFVHSTRLEVEATQILTRRLRTVPMGAVAFNPARPQPEQRNRPLTLDQLHRLGVTTNARVLQEDFQKVGVTTLDQLRVLVCEGDSLLAWVGAFREEPFSPEDVSLLRHLVPALHHRLWLERQLDISRFALAALDHACSLLPGASFVLQANGGIAHANDAAKRLLEQDAAKVHERLAASLRQPGPEAPFAVTRLDARGAPRHFLATERGAGEGLQAKLSEARQRWRLTQRQTEVLARILQGYANKSIAAALQCSPKTVEVHVSAILQKAGASSRTELLAALLRF